MNEELVFGLFDPIAFKHGLKLFGLGILFWIILIILVVFLASITENSFNLMA